MVTYVVFLRIIIINTKIIITNVLKFKSVYMQWIALKSVIGLIFSSTYIYIYISVRTRGFMWSNFRYNYSVCVCVCVCVCVGGWVGGCVSLCVGVCVYECVCVYLKILYTITLRKFVVRTRSVCYVTLLRETGLVHRITHNFNNFFPNLLFYLLSFLLI
jgi:hypothetical protein